MLVDGPAQQTQALVRVFVAGEGPFRFTLDTGASQSLVDRRLARDVDAPIVARGRPVVGVAGAARADVARLERWRVGSVRLPSVRVAVVPLRAATGTGARPSRGLLGSDVLRRFGLVTVDYANGRLVLGRDQPIDRSRWRSVDLRVVRGLGGSTLIFANVAIGGETVPFAVDTGASRSAIEAGLAARSGLEVRAREQTVVGIGGVVSADVVEVRRWNVAGVRLPRSLAAAIDFPDAPPGAPFPRLRGLLGSDVLRQFGAIAIDFDEGLLWLRGA